MSKIAKRSRRRRHSSNVGLMRYGYMADRKRRTRHKRSFFRRCVVQIQKWKSMSQKGRVYRLRHWIEREIAPMVAIMSIMVIVELCVLRML